MFSFKLTNPQHVNAIILRGCCFGYQGLFPHARILSNCMCLFKPIFQKAEMWVKLLKAYTLEKGDHEEVNQKIVIIFNYLSKK